MNIRVCQTRRVRECSWWAYDGFFAWLMVFIAESVSWDLVFGALLERGDLTRFA